MTGRGNGSPPRDGEPLVDVLPDADAATRAAATLLASALADAVRQRGRADWATTGGSTVVPIYRHLATPPLRDLVPWDRVHVWWGDDRFVPRDHPLSNRLPFDQALLGMAGKAGLSGSGAGGIDVELGALPGVSLPASNVHGMPIEAALADNAPEEAAAAYAAELEAAPLPHDPSGAPILDVILVGIGPDGHVFSVFPGSPLLDSPALVSGVPAPTHVEPHVARVSLSPRFLTAARLLVTVVLGAGKAAIVDAVLTGPRDIRRYPSQLARRPGAAWFLDEAAASRLPHRDPSA
ncbi:MAG TPA: 6-phosphogluconolactonase [Candidatus Limnocylindrales bacterium]|nr:6-phosphogluconolactonase [Candidatus Limnocylindrales bacterium]